MRPPTARPGPNRAQTATPTLNGRASPTESLASSRQRTPKRKAHSEMELPGGEETNINVVVRCRGRNDREVRENSGVVVATNGVKGSQVELSMGPSAVSNKTYQFDKVFSPAADQGMVFDEVVAPILDEVRLDIIAWYDGTTDLPVPRFSMDSTALFLRTARPVLARHTQCPATSPTCFPFPTELVSCREY